MRLVTVALTVAFFMVTCQCMIENADSRTTWSKKKPQCVPLLYETSLGYAHCPTRALSLNRLTEWSKLNGIYGLNNFEFIISDDGYNVGTKLTRELKRDQLFVSAPYETLLTGSLAQRLSPFDVNAVVKGSSTSASDFALAVFVSEVVSFSEYRRGDAFAKSSWSPLVDFSAFAYWRPFIDSVAPGKTYIEDFSADDMKFVDDLSFVSDEMKSIDSWTELYSKVCDEQTDSSYSVCEHVTNDLLARRARRIMESRYFSLVIGELYDAALIPILDLVNHAPRDYESLDYGYNESRNAFVMTGWGDFTKGKAKELTISYGQDSNERLLRQYGFALRFNTDDYVKLIIPVNDRLKDTGHATSNELSIDCELRLKSDDGGCLKLWRIFHSRTMTTHCDPSVFDSVLSLENEEKAVNSLLMSLRYFESTRVWSRPKINDQLKRGNNSINVQHTMFVYAGEMTIAWLYSELLELVKDHLIPIAKKPHISKTLDEPSVPLNQYDSELKLEGWGKQIDAKLQSLRDHMMSEWESPAIEFFTPIIKSYTTAIASAPSSNPQCIETAVA